MVVSDNGSSDATVSVVERFAARLPHLRVVDSSGRVGRSHARNVGARAAAADALAFCDADDEVAPGWVAAMGNALAAYDFVAGQLEWEKLNDPWTIRLCRAESCGPIAHNYPPYMPFAASGNVGVKRALHEAIGGFDENLVRLQDADYSWRIQLSGAAPHYAPDALVHVRLRATLSQVFRQVYGKALYDVLLYKMYRPRGMPPVQWRNGLRAWRGLALSLPKSVRDEQAWIAWVHELAWRLGRVHGSIRFRTLAF